MLPGPSGNAALGLLSDPLSFLESTTERYGRVVGLRLGPESVVLFSDPSTARGVLATHASLYAKVRGAVTA